MSGALVLQGDPVGVAPVEGSTILAVIVASLVGLVEGTFIRGVSCATALTIVGAYVLVFATRCVTCLFASGGPSIETEARHDPVEQALFVVFRGCIQAGGEEYCGIQGRPYLWILRGLVGSEEGEFVAEYLVPGRGRGQVYHAVDVH